MKKLNFALLLALCFLLYANSLNNAFVSDDIPAIRENPSISHPLRFWTKPPDLLNSFCFLIAKDNPFVYHLTSIMLHGINTILVFIFLGLFFSPLSSLLGASLFAAHPAHVEAVAWVSGKPYLFLTLAILATYLLYYASTGKRQEGAKPKAFLYVLSLLIFSYSLIENAGFYFLTPLFLILSDISLKRWRSRWKYWLPFLIILALRIMLIKAVILQRQFYLADVVGGNLVSGNPMIKFTLVIFNHIKLVFWPVKLTLFHEPVGYNPALLVLGMAFLAILILAMPFIFKKSKEVFLGIAIFILFLFPVYSPIPLASNLVAERYVYFPSIALSIFAAWLYEKCARPLNKAQRNIVWGIFLILIFLCALRTLIRNEDWKTPERFWKATVAASPDSPSAYNALGLMYKEKGELKNAVAAFEKSIALKPDYTFAYNNLGNLYSDIGKKDEAVSYYKKVLAINPRDLDVYYNLGITYSEMGRIDEAVASFKKAVEINPRDAASLINLGVVYAGMGRIEDARASFQQAIRVDPDNAAAGLNLRQLETPRK